MTGKLVTNTDLREWRVGHGLTQSRAAPLFGVGLRKYQNMETIHEVLPRMVALVMLGYDAEQAQQEAEELREWAASAKSVLESAPYLVKTFRTKALSDKD